MLCCVDVVYGLVVTVWGCFFRAEDGIRDLVRSRGLGDVYKRQAVSTGDPGSGGAPAIFVAGGSASPSQERSADDVLSLIHI